MKSLRKSLYDLKYKQFLLILCDFDLVPQMHLNKSSIVRRLSFVIPWLPLCWDNQICSSETHPTRLVQSSVPLPTSWGGPLLESCVSSKISSSLWDHQTKLLRNYPIGHLEIRPSLMFCECNSLVGISKRLVSHPLYTAHNLLSVSMAKVCRVLQPTYQVFWEFQWWPLPCSVCKSEHHVHLHVSGVLDTFGNIVPHQSFWLLHHCL